MAVATMLAAGLSMRGRERMRLPEPGLSELWYEERARLRVSLDCAESAMREAEARMHAQAEELRQLSASLAASARAETRRAQATAETAVAVTATTVVTTVPEESAVPAEPPTTAEQTGTIPDAEMEEDALL